MIDDLSDDLLNEYLDGELGEAERQAVAAAIARSPTAQARLVELETLFAAFADMQDVSLAKDLTPGVLTAVAAMPAPAPPWLRLLPLIQVVIAALLVIVFWPVLPNWWDYGRALLPTTLPSLALPDVNAMMREWGTAVANLPLPAIQLNLALYQWAILVGLALIIWLLGARLLFSEHRGSHA